MTSEWIEIVNDGDIMYLNNGGADKILDTLTSKNAYAKRSHLYERSDYHRTHFV